MAIKVSSPVFKEGDTLGIKYSCDGENISPPLAWEGIPGKAKSIAIMIDDPDSPSETFTHWIIFNLPPDQSSLDENIPKVDTLQNGAIQGTNDAGKVGYFGPCPPHGEIHRYVFHIFALDKILELHSWEKKDVFKAEIYGHIAARGTITARFGR